MQTIKRKLLLLLAGLLGVTLTALAAVLMLQQRTQVISGITQNAIHFAELSSGPVAGLYDLYFRSQSYALFQSELATLLARNPDIVRLEIITASGERLFDSTKKPEEKLPAVTDPAFLARLSANKLSLATAEKTVYLTRSTSGAGVRTETLEGKKTEPLAASATVATVIQPLPDNARRVVWHVSYAAAAERVWQAVQSLVLLFLFGFGLSFVVATRFAATLTAPLLALRHGAEKLAAGDLETQITVRSNDETRLLADTFNRMTHELKQAIASRVQHERAARELEVASEIQTSTLPQDCSVAGLDLAFHFTPASEVGGDIYDVLTLPDGRAIFYLADATGHGVPAGMVAALTSAIVATAAVEGADLATILVHANQILYRKTRPNMFVTLALFGWSPATRQLQFAAAGHEPPLIFRAASGTVEAVSAAPNLGLGMLAEWPQAPILQTVQLAAGDCLLAYTDGLTEQRDAADQEFGSAKLQKLLQQVAPGQPAEMVLQAVAAAAEQYRGAVPLADDSTLLACRLA